MVSPDSPPDNTIAAEIESARSQALEAIGNTANAESLRILASELRGKRSSLTQLKAKLGAIADADARKATGQQINNATQAVEQALAERLGLLTKQGFAAQIADERVDLTEFVTADRWGHAHIVTQSTEQLEDVFIGLGFNVAEGPEVETDFYNFEALNMPKSHPARSGFDTIFLNSGDADVPDSESVLLRTHTSPVQIRVMQTWDLPIYAVMPGRVFRRDTPDATHMPVFHQIEGLVIDRNISFGHLAGTIEAFTKAYFGSDFTSRLRPSYFPFTEPSAEFDIRRANGNWMELGGCGMVHPNVLRACRIDPDVYTGFAFGFGIDRMAKEHHGVEDIREMYTNDLRFLRQF
ncbi:MAG: phenylalanine--tRNA ligase subunit alpha [Ilumatobacteraceae bacterium]